MRRKRLIAAFVVALGAVAGATLLWRGGTPRIAVALGLAEGCVACHGDVAGLTGAHAPQAIGCAACHAGDRSTLDKARAHANMELVPGNLADASRTCGQAGCHDAIVPRVERSIMATMAGVIAVNRTVLGESDPPGAPLPHAQRLGHGVADSHLRELCVGCHLGQVKSEWGPIGETTQGGGCLSCHLEYDAGAAVALAAYAALPREARKAAPAAHPSLTVNPRNGHCFGCHSRSGRIALSYEGWHEMHIPGGGGPADPNSPNVRKLGDGRYVEKVVEDVHHQRGLECIDCHTANEVMGPGAEAARKSQQLRIDCEDCHTKTPASVEAEFVNAESRALARIRNQEPGAGERMATTRDGEPLVNVFVAEGKGAWLLRKRTGEALPLKPPAAACTEGNAHARLSCASCHTAWAPRCVACHTSFDPKGEGFDHAAQAWVQGSWNESAGPFEATLPTLGVLADGAARGTIDTFVPGMVMTFDRNRDPGRPPEVLFRRLYAKLFPHTIRREARSCTSCHADPVAMGFGKGDLWYVVEGTSGRWRFTPAGKRLPQDGLPEDAWTGFLQERTGMVSTREDARPFSVAEQRRILAVGACLTCHHADSPTMRRATEDFPATIARRSPRCALPAWP